jgi:hypothetical protein
MRQRGRKSVDNLVAINVSGVPPRLEPPAGLRDDERTLFRELIAACPPQHFVGSDLPLLTSFLQATLLARSSAHDPKKLDTWERAVRLQATLATRLRLAPRPAATQKPWPASKPTQARDHGKEIEMRTHTRGDRVINWVEEYCRYPDGPKKGEPVRLSQEQCWQIRQIYDHPDGPQGMPVTGAMAAYLALLHVCGPEARQHDFRPTVDVDVWTVWRSTSAELQAVLKRDGEQLICPALGTRWPVSA